MITKRIAWRVQLQALATSDIVGEYAKAVEIMRRR